MATASTSWMPVAGRHNVSIGSSLSKALKARKGQPPTQRSKALPDRDFYALRYNHKPASIDPTKSGTLEVTPGREVTTVRVERPTVNNNEVIVFKGEEKPAKEWECVLIYDEATQTFTLEKLDSLVNLNFDAKAPPRTRPAAPSPPSASSSSAAQTPRRSPVRTAADELEAQLEGASVGLGGVHYPDEDADGEPDPSFSLAQGGEQEEVTGAAPPPRRSSSAHHRKAAPPAPQAPQAAQQSKARPTPSSRKSALASQSAKAARVSAANAQPTPAPSSSSSKPRPRPITSAPAPAPPPTSTPTMLGSAKRTAAALENPDDEDFEIRGPIAPVNVAPSAMRRTSTAMATATGKAPPVAQARGSSFSLALPSASAGPDPLAQAQGLYNGGAAAASSGLAESDDEWDEILAQPDRTPPPHHHHHHSQQQQEPMLTITIEDDADDGLDFLERELLGEDEPMGDVDGDEEDDMEEDVVEMGHHNASSRAGAGTGPMSMNQFVGGQALVEDEDDDYSSSEESDED